jgi:hypothetical protein
MIILATGLLTIFHPGACFRGSWHAITRTLQTQKSTDSIGKIPGEEDRMMEEGK